MDNIADVIKGLELCTKVFYGAAGICDLCPYFKHEGLCVQQLNKDALEHLKSQQAEIERLQPKWIPVSERLPKTGKAVLVCCDDKLHKSMVVAYVDALGLWHPISNDHIAYWMPLPEPPKDGDGE